MLSEKEIQAQFEKSIKSLCTEEKQIEYNWDELRNEVVLAYTGAVSDKVYKGYWQKDGVYNKLLLWLSDTFIPRTGTPDIHNINLLIDINNITYDFYNNGWWNKRKFRFSENLDKELYAIRNLAILMDTYSREDVPFTDLQLEYAINAIVRKCIGASDLDDEKVYPNIEIQ
jgi:hypothetical protein